MPQQTQFEFDPGCASDVEIDTWLQRHIRHTLSPSLTDCVIQTLSESEKRGCFVSWVLSTASSEGLPFPEQAEEFLTWFEDEASTMECLFSADDDNDDLPCLVRAAKLRRHALALRLLGLKPFPIGAIQMNQQLEPKNHVTWYPFADQAGGVYFRCNAQGALEFSNERLREHWQMCQQGRWNTQPVLYPTLLTLSPEFTPPQQWGWLEADLVPRNWQNRLAPEIIEQIAYRDVFMLSSSELMPHGVRLAFRGEKPTASELDALHQRLTVTIEQWTQEVTRSGTLTLDDEPDPQAIPDVAWKDPSQQTWKQLPDINVSWKWRQQLLDQGLPELLADYAVTILMKDNLSHDRGRTPGEEGLMRFLNEKFLGHTLL